MFDGGLTGIYTQGIEFEMKNRKIGANEAAALFRHQIGNFIGQHNDDLVARITARLSADNGGQASNHA